MSLPGKWNKFEVDAVMEEETGSLIQRLGDGDTMQDVTDATFLQANSNFLPDS